MRPHGHFFIVDSPVYRLPEHGEAMRRERHVQFRVRLEQTTLPVIAFNFADRVEELMAAEGKCCMVFTPGINEWQGWRHVQLELVDFQAGDKARFGE